MHHVNGSHVPVKKPTWPSYTTSMCHQSQTAFCQFISISKIFNSGPQLEDSILPDDDIPNNRPTRLERELARQSLLQNLFFIAKYCNHVLEYISVILCEISVQFVILNNIFKNDVY